jgi:hypothetical protein
VPKVRLTRRSADAASSTTLQLPLARRFVVKTASSPLGQTNFAKPYDEDAIFV